MYHNVVTSVDNGKVQYMTDTQEGSSGSPVFNSNWEVVALHHSSTRYSENGGRDKLCNQGTSSEVLKEQIQKAILDLKF
jgi:V8-like Glu-specific endopeptidase